MNQELMDMAVKAGIQEGEFERYKGEDGKRKAYMMLPEELEAFAKLVAASEREACAKLADEYATWGGSNFFDWFKKLSAAIRARGETK